MRSLDQSLPIRATTVYECDECITSGGPILEKSQGRVLIVEDDSVLRHSLCTTLNALGFDIHEAGSGEEALRRLHMADYEVVLLDINMPGMGGFEACRQIRGIFINLPILMLTVRNSEDDKVDAFDAGADDYIVKPFQILELTARIRSAVRRFRSPAVPTEMPMEIGAIMLDPIRRRVERCGEVIHLTPREFDALKMLMEHAGRPITHDELSVAIGVSSFGKGREYLRVLISQLRKKIEDDPAKPFYLGTDCSIGYRFRDP